MKINRITLLIFILWLCHVLAPGTAQAQSFSGYLPRVEKDSGNLNITINTLKQEKEFYIYYRTKGLKKFQVRKMKTGKEGNVYYQLATENLYGKELEYFIVENRGSGSRSQDSISPVFTVSGFTDKESPEVYFLDAGPGAEGGGAKDPLFFRIGASLSSATRIHDDSDAPGKKFDANGNIRLYKNIYNEKYQFDFDTNFAYTHNPSETESKINLSNMKIAYKKGTHTIEAGDLSINNTEFTTSSLSRRGIFYQMEGKALYLSTFIANSQQKTGFEGFGVPPSAAYLFGASAGFNMGTVVKVRGMFMTGKDNLDSKTVTASEEVYREGNLYSVWGELNLFKSHLLLKGEFTRSSFGKAQEIDKLEKESDTAWRAGADLNYGVVSAHVDYKKIGGQFSSIANLFLENDWEGLAGNIGLSIKSFSLNVRYTDRKTNLSSEIQPMLHTKNISSDFNWLIANHIQVGAEFGLDNLDYDKSTGLQTGSEDMDTIRYAATLGYIAGSNGITVRIGKTESKTFTSNIDASAAVNLRFGNFLSLNPTVSYQSTENFTDDSTSKIYNAYLSSELTFIPELFSLSVSGSWTKTDNTFTDSTVLTAGGNLNLYLAKAFNQKIQPTLSLRGKYEDYKNGDTSNSNVTVYLQADLSF
ncbi:MAG: hypothetical protein GY950_25805 [bacterium]|nr:hypothetical protein [bacterium]